MRSILVFTILTAMLTGLAIVAVRWPVDRPLPKLLPGALLGAISANLAVVHAAWRFLHGRHDHVWEPTRRSVGSRSV